MKFALCEVDKLRVHAQSPLSVGACLLYPLSHPGTPSLPPRYQSSSLLWVPPTSSDLPSHSSLLTLVVGRAIFRARHWISMVTAHSLFKLDWVLDPGWAPLACLLRSRCVLPAGAYKPSARSHAVISGLQPSRQQSSPFHLACFRAYASSELLPVRLQGSIPGLWLAVTRAGLSPARVARHCHAAT